MEGISFEEEGAQRRRHPDTEPNGMTERLIRSGFVQGRTAANVVLIAAALVLVAAAILVYILMNQQNVPSVPPGTQVVTTPGAPPRLMTPIGHRI